MLNTIFTHMMDPRILITICFVLFFIVIFLLQQVTGTCGEKLIPGFWVVSEQFKEEAGIDQLVLYFDEGKGYEYTGYMVMVVDGETVFNGTMKFRISPNGYFKSECYMIVMEKDIDQMPKKMLMVIYPNEGMMELKCQDTKKKYAQFFKDNQMSAQTILKIGDNEPTTDTDSEQEVPDSEDV